VHLTTDDVIPLVVYLSLETGLPIESIWELKSDCLQNEINGYADLWYVKRRKGTDKLQKERVKTDGLTSPGGIIKLVLRLTRKTRDFARETEGKWLFIGIALRRQDGRPLRRFGETVDANNRFCSRHEIKDDKGNLLKSIVLARLRKSFKKERYLKAVGHLGDVATDHTKRILARRYADIPALRPLHEQTIAEALQQALDNALEPLVVDAEGERLFQEDPKRAAEVFGITTEQAEHVASGTQDVWLASCLDNESSPFQDNGTGSCRSPVWGCLECNNAVITSSKLPAVLAFLNHILQRRKELDLDVWKARYGRAYGRIIKQVIPRFPATEIAAAKAIAEAETDLIWLPAELTMSL
jgi:hypothetical protein